MSNMSWAAQTVLEAEYHVLHVVLTFMKKDKDSEFLNFVFHLKTTSPPWGSFI